MHKKKWLVPFVLLAGMVLVAFWEIMANRSRDPFRPFTITAEDFRTFSPSSSGWSFKSFPVSCTPSEPNILAFKVVNSGNNASVTGLYHVSRITYHDTPILVRLVHGYNMADCMRIKGYKVELMGEQRAKSKAQSAGLGTRRNGNTEKRRNGSGSLEPGTQNSELATSIQEESSGRLPCDARTQNPASSIQYPGFPPQADFRRGRMRQWSTPPADRSQVLNHIQIWRLTSGSGDVSIWVTSMIRAGDFSLTDVDVRSMPFPRVGVPDDPGWFPRGFTWSSLRHPVKEFGLFMRAKWNT